jgi:hypothetical protein
LLGDTLLTNNGTLLGDTLLTNNGTLLGDTLLTNNGTLLGNTATIDINKNIMKTHINIPNDDEA